MIPRTACVVLLSVLAFGGTAVAQGRPPPQSFTMAEAYSEIEVLKQQLAALQQQAAQQKAQSEQELTAARFRITVLEADMKVGGTTTQLQKSIDVLGSRVGSLEGSEKQLEGFQKQDGQAFATLTNRLDALATQFKGHTHTYKLTTFGFQNHELAPPIHIGDNGLPTQTSPPN